MSDMNRRSIFRRALAGLACLVGVKGVAKSDVIQLPPMDEQYWRLREREWMETVLRQQRTENPFVSLIDGQAFAGEHEPIFPRVLAQHDPTIEL